MKVGGALVLGVAVLCAGGLNPASATSEQTHRKSKRQQIPPPPLPSGPTGRPVQQIPLDTIPPVQPEVTYQGDQLTIIAPNSTLADILRAVRKQTGAEIDIPAAPERVVTHLGPGPARDVVAELLNGSRFNYVLLGSPSDNGALTRVVLVAKMAQQVAENPSTLDPSQAPAAGVANAPQPPEQMPDAEADSTGDNADDNADQSPPDTEDQPPDQNGIKTPQQMLQEMQQRQMQLQQQQQQQPGQPPAPGRPVAPQPQDQQ